MHCIRLEGSIRAKQFVLTTAKSRANIHLASIMHLSPLVALAALRSKTLVVVDSLFIVTPLFVEVLSLVFVL